MGHPVVDYGPTEVIAAAIRAIVKDEATMHALKIIEALDKSGYSITADAQRVRAVRRELRKSA